MPTKKTPSKNRASKKPIGSSKKFDASSYASALSGGRYVRLSDASVKTVVNRAVGAITKDRKAALSFLQDLGISTPTGKLTKRYGG
ncbi:conserved hypothetical protein [Xanthomonas citri pv. fuscans]|nr:conserved hypothetical protein [Xanthomonas citri pv. fuscans]SOO35485.1 conserved hypothetical protein [Xanthomonas citri pv. fuscans]